MRPCGRYRALNSGGDQNRFGARRSWLKAASAHLLNANYATQPDEPGMVQPFPATAAACTALGWPSPTALWLCDEAAGNLVDEIGAVALVPTNAPLQNRSLYGVAFGSDFWSKVAVETYNSATTSNQRFLCANAALLNIGNLVDFTLSLGLRSGSAFLAVGATERLVSKYDGALGWEVSVSSPTQVRLLLRDATGFTYHDYNGLPYDGAFHLFTISVVRNGNVSFFLDDIATANVAAARPGDLTSATGLCLLNTAAGGFDFHGQCSWFYLNIGTAATRTGHNAMWRHLKASGLGFPGTYTRASVMVVPIAVDKAAAAGPGRVGIGYHANAVSAANGNALGTGLVCENPITYHPIGSTNTMGYSTAVGAGETGVSDDGASAMRDGVKATQGGAFNPAVNFFVYTPNAGGVPTAPTNVPWWVGGYYRRGAVGTSARVSLVMAGDPGGTEIFTVLNDAAAPATDTQFGAVCSVTRAAHNILNLDYGANANTEIAILSEFHVVRNWLGSSSGPLAWIRVGTAAAASMSLPVESIDNTAGTRFDPVSGVIDVEMVGYRGVLNQIIAAYATGTLPVFPCYDGSRIWIPNNTTNNVTVRLARDGSLVNTYASGGNGCWGSCFDGTYVWVTNFASASVTKFRASDGAVIGTYATGLSPTGCCFDGTNIWICNYGANTVTKLLAATGALVGTYATGVQPYCCCYDGTNIWITNNNGGGAGAVTKLLAATGGLGGTYAVGNGPQGICFDGTNIWTANGTGNSVTKLLAATGALVGTYAVGTLPRGILFDGTYIWVANAGASDYRLMKLNSAGTSQGTLHLTGGGCFICLDNSGHLWATSQAAGTNTITKILNRTVLLAAGTEYAAGALMIDQSPGWQNVPLMGTVERLRLRAWDSTGALALSLSGTTISDTLYHHLRWRYDARAPVYRTGGVSYYALLEEISAANPDGAVLDQGGLAAWTPGTNPAAIYIGSNGVDASARCLISSYELRPRAEYKSAA